MKKLLLKIAYLINKHYNTTEIKFNDIIKVQNQYYQINEMSITKDWNSHYVSLKAIDTTIYLKNQKYNYI